MYCVYLTNTSFQQSFTVIYHSKQTHNIGTTWCKSQGAWKPVQLAAKRSRIHLVWNMQVGCYAFHFDLNLTLNSAGLPTSSRYHHLFTSTAANHGSTNTSAWWEWNRIEQNDRRFIQYATCWNPTTTWTPLSSPWRCKYSHWKYDPGLTIMNWP